METAAHNFTGPTSEAYGPSGLVLGANGALFLQSTNSSGQSCCGSMYQLSPPEKGTTTWTERILCQYSPQNGDGNGPGELIADRSGSLFGLTSSDGDPGRKCGTVFELILPTTTGGAWQELQLHAFAGVSPDSYGPSDLMLAANGNLYGTTAGNYQYGMSPAIVLKLERP